MRSNRASESEKGEMNFFPRQCPSMMRTTTTMAIKMISVWCWWWWWLRWRWNFRWLKVLPKSSPPRREEHTHMLMKSEPTNCRPLRSCPWPNTNLMQTSSLNWNEDETQIELIIGVGDYKELLRQPAVLSWHTTLLLESDRCPPWKHGFVMP